MRFPFCRNRDSVKNGILISIRRTGDGFHPGLFSQNGATTTASPKTTNANHANKKSTNGKVKTGDNNHMILYTVSLVLSLMIAAGCIYTIISKRRKNR